MAELETSRNIPKTFSTDVKCFLFLILNSHYHWIKNFAMTCKYTCYFFSMWIIFLKALMCTGKRYVWTSVWYLFTYIPMIPMYVETVFDQRPHRWSNKTFSRYAHLYVDVNECRVPPEICRNYIILCDTYRYFDVHVRRVPQTTWEWDLLCDNYLYPDVCCVGMSLFMWHTFTFLCRR